MNKDSIYRIIGYNGEYTASVKRAIRKLLKENHPDNKGDRKTFELINEVKKELEENRVSYNSKSTKDNIKINDDIDYLYCTKMIDEINDKLTIYTKELKEKEEKLNKYTREYKDYYRDSIDLESKLLNNSKKNSELKNLKSMSILLLILSIIAFMLSLLTRNIVFYVLFIVLVAISVYVIHKAFLIMQKATDNNHNKVNNYVGVNNKIRDNQTNQEKLRKEIGELDKKIKRLENDLRFYHNIIGDNNDSTRKDY